MNSSTALRRSFRAVEPLFGREATRRPVAMVAEARPDPSIPREPRPAAQSLPGLIGVSEVFRRVIELAERVAPSDASVFITGPSGAGKEMIARFIHQRSRRATQPFVAINCAALPEPLLESEMFGHRKGAFTNAVRDKAGLMEAANGGTLFLDELLEMAKPIQAKLLRVIQDGVVRRVGSEIVDAVVNVRFIAATNAIPEDAVDGGTLREDLLYRLKVVPIHLPSLRERLEDIPILAAHFLSELWARHRPGTPVPRISADAVQTLQAYAWPGNVRELQNVVERIVVLAETRPVIDSSVVTTALGETPSRPSVSRFAPATPHEGYHVARERIVSEFETQYLLWLLDRAEGNMARAARLAGIDRATLYRMVERRELHRLPSAGWCVDRTQEPDSYAGGAATLQSPR